MSRTALRAPDAAHVPHPRTAHPPPPPPPLPPPLKTPQPAVPSKVAPARPAPPSFKKSFLDIPGARRTPSPFISISSILMDSPFSSLRPSRVNPEHPFYLL
jgi:hypothetical protein